MTDKNKIEFEALALFEASMNIEQSKRKAWIEHEARDQPALLAKALHLLAIEQRSDKQMLTGNAFTDAQASHNHPSRIGAYKITAFIGQGGMGAVYKGERDQGDFEQCVAIKIIREGALSNKLIERFVQEQQTLAKLIHPNIARLYDGGKTQDGKPYLIMEYVDGAPLLHWISANDLNQEQILQLFNKVCSAVRYAHQNLIIHRDITPSNIMVTNDGEVKLIDFGIAKALVEHDESEPTITNNKNPAQSLASLSFTPGFAAPERKKASPLLSTQEALTTSSAQHNKEPQAQYTQTSTLLDIYSLGKLLAAMLRETQSSPELNSIIAKASAFMPQDRYATVNELMEDINNYRQKMPIAAHSVKPSYRFKKFTQRHTKGVFISAFTALTLIISLLVSLSQYYRAENALEQANNRFDQIRELSTYQIFELFDQLSRVAGTTSARADLADKAQSYLAILSGQDQASVDVKLETIQGYLRLAYIYGIPAQPNLGMQKEAKENLQTAENLLNVLEAKLPPSADMISTRVGILAARALAYTHNDGNINKAKTLIDEASLLMQSVSEQKRNLLWHKTRRSLRNASLEWADQASDSAQINAYATAFRNDTTEWPAELQNSYLKAQDENYYYYWLAMAHYVEEEHADAVADFLIANEKLAGLEAEQKNDPMLLYILAWTNFMGYGSATRLDDDQVISDFLDRATQYTERLKAVEEQDAAIYRLSLQMREAKSQLLAAQGDFEQALIVQQGVVDELAESVKSKELPANIYSLAFSHIILAYMHKDTDNRPDTCKSLRIAETLLRPLAAKNSLPEYMLNAANRLPERVVDCETGKAIKSMNALFD